MSVNRTYDAGSEISRFVVCGSRSCIDVPYAELFEIHSAFSPSVLHLVQCNRRMPARDTYF